MADYRLYVADASVLVKWFLKEEGDSYQALALRRDFTDSKVDIAVPDFCYYEIMNALGRRSSDLAVVRFLSDLLASGISECRLTLEMAARAVAIVKQLGGVSFYDAFYHVLAMHHGGVFITADEKYYKKARKLKSILLLKDYHL